MNYEKSCGAVVFRETANSIHYLIILNKKGNYIGHWGFPKGHMEEGESEFETAKREILEETGLEVEFIDGFREVVNYSPRPGIKKDAVYFLAKAASDNVTLQKSEVAGFRWLTYEKALKQLSHDAKILDLADEYLR